ncbi:hypothetical protein BGX31_000664 [Mortierella sp. GBA43]|nr:hypothetical protein BGX31_000664 [Mortierella sp. GBA43]
MARHSNPVLVGNSIHGQTQAALLKLHQQSLEKTLNSVMTVIDDDDKRPQRCQRKKKKYYPWIQRDSQNQRNKIDKFVHHPCAVLYQVDLPFPGYDRDAPTFHWKYDTVVESLINNNPPSSRRSKPAGTGSQDKASSPAVAEPKIGHRLLTRAQRKDIKKVHVPKGIVMQYEGELVNFLDQLTLDASSDDEDSDSETPLSESVIVVTEDNGESTVMDRNWVLVQSSDLSTEESSPLAGTTATSSDNESVTSEQPQTQQQTQQQQQQSEENQPQIYLRWDIQDQFLRFVAHALCAFYGLVSFSKTALDGKRHLYICHPAHLDSIGQIAAPAEPVDVVPSRPKLPKRQSTLEHVQELPLHELDQLWKKIEPVKLLDCPRPDITFFEYLYPSTHPMF